MVVDTIGFQLRVATREQPTSLTHTPSALYKDRHSDHPRDMRSAHAQPIAYGTFAAALWRRVVERVSHSKFIERCLDKASIVMAERPVTTTTAAPDFTQLCDLASELVSESLLDGLHVCERA